MRIYLITKNSEKLEAANRVFSSFNIKLDLCAKEFPEIQADTSLEIAKYTALQAAKELNEYAIREDHSLYINALGVPGPYMAYFEKRLPVSQLLKILSLSNDRAGYFEVATVLATPSGETQEYVYRVLIHFKEREFVKDKRNGWNGVICLEGEGRAFTEYPYEERLEYWLKNYRKIAEYLVLQRDFRFMSC